MRLAMIGLGRMGGNMTRRLVQGGHEVVAYDRRPEAAEELTPIGARAARDLRHVCEQLPAPRVIWLMVPAGAPVDDMLDALMPFLERGDIVIDGGNSNFHDTIRRAARLREHGLRLLDVGTSGGIWGLQVGYCLMIGGDPDAFAACEPVFRTLAPEQGYARVGPSGAGHYVKMIHNGVEYGLLQAYAEGYELLHAAREYTFDLHRIAALWNRGSVVRSWLNELAERAFSGDGALEGIRGYVEDSGEGRWTVETAIDLDVPAPVITLSLLQRFRSRQADSFSARVIAALRREFGGHAVREA